RRGHGNTRRDAAHHLVRDAMAPQQQCFLATASEHERIAAFYTRNDKTLTHETEHEALDDALWCRWLATALADVDHPRILADVIERAAVDEIIDQHDIGFAQEAHRLERQELRIPWAGADQV